MPRWWEHCRLEREVESEMAEDDSDVQLLLTDQVIDSASVRDLFALWFNEPLCPCPYLQLWWS